MCATNDNKILSKPHVIDSSFYAFKYVHSCYVSMVMVQRPDPD
jgi:hypothetical protein